MQMLVAAYNIANRNPLGSAAGYGSSFPLDREMTTSLLGFETLHYNVVAAQMSRGKPNAPPRWPSVPSPRHSAIRAMDVCMWMCQNFGFVSFP